MKPTIQRLCLVTVVLGGVITIVAAIFWMRGLNQAPAPRTPDPLIPPQTIVPAPEVPDAAPPEPPEMRIEPDELARAGRERDDNGVKMKFCWCPPGTFPMGGDVDSSGRPRRQSQVSVTISHGFWMGKFEVTQAQWKQVMGLTLREQRAKDPDQPRPVGDGTTRDHVGEGPEYPIYFTSHGDAEEFCRKLTEGERAAGRLEAGWQYRLPTEAQWEFACRAGTTSASAFGDRLSGTDANFDGTKPFNGAPAGPYLHNTTPVGSYSPNAWGLHDMHGNVWEWCRDGYANVLAGGTDPFQVTSTLRRSYRGGCWHNNGYMCLSAMRGFGDESDRGSGLGFRVALVADGP